MGEKKQYQILRWGIGIWVVTLYFFNSSISFAGPPFFTDDPEPVDYKHWEVYLAGVYSHERHGKSGAAPIVEVNYGPWPDFHLHFIAPGIFSKEDGGSAAYGYGDTELGLKYRPIHESDSCPQIGTFPIVELPTGDQDRGFGNGKAQVFFPLWLQKSWGPWTSYGGGGYWYNPGKGNKNWVFTGWELQRDMSEHLTLGGEIFFRTADEVDAENSVGFNLGGIYNFDDGHHLLFSVGRDIRGPDIFTGYVGFQRTF